MQVAVQGLGIRSCHDPKSPNCIYRKMSSMMLNPKAGVFSNIYIYMYLYVLYTII